MMAKVSVDGQPTDEQLKLTRDYITRIGQVFEDLSLEAVEKHQNTGAAAVSFAAGYCAAHIAAIMLDDRGDEKIMELWQSLMENALEDMHRKRGVFKEGSDG